MDKIWVEGFRGSWGWIKDFEACTENIAKTKEEADVIFQCDPIGWQENLKYIGKKKIVANILDYAEWNGGNPAIELYVEHFCKKADKVTAISAKVIGQTKERGIDASLFYYPSQVDSGVMNSFSNSLKEDYIISFCRLHDKGKRIEEAAHAFSISNLPKRGWRYLLFGPQQPCFDTCQYKNVEYMGFSFGKYDLFKMVSKAKAVIMPSVGEGLGLPAIEGALVGTQPICRFISPARDIFANEGSYFLTFEGLVECMDSLLFETTAPNLDLVLNWEKYRAFSGLKEMLGGV